MSSRINSFLVNDPFGDPGLLVQFSNKRRSFLFDMGDISKLSPRQILNLSHIFITHTHMDHFFGFDRVLRLCLGTNKQLYFFGPPGFLSNIEGKLAGYQWNLLKSYEHDFTIHASEVFDKNVKSRTYHSSNQFKIQKEKCKKIKKNILLSEDDFEVIVATLDHGIPCLAFSIQEKPYVKILPKRIKLLGLKQGAWIKEFKKCLHSKSKSKITLSVDKLNTKKQTFNIEKLAKKITFISKGEKITYITDVNFSKKNQETILDLAYKSTHLYIEATFASKHSNLASGKYHLTAKQAGKLAQITKTKKYTLFHHSQRYNKQAELLNKEAESIFAEKM